MFDKEVDAGLSFGITAQMDLEHFLGKTVALQSAVKFAVAVHLLGAVAEFQHVSGMAFGEDQFPVLVEQGELVPAPGRVCHADNRREREGYPFHLG